MAKYVNKKFCPYIYSDWIEIFKTMDVDQRSELLLAISAFPNYEPKGVVLWGFFKSQLQVQYDTWLERSEIYRSNAKSKKAIDSVENPQLPTGSNSEQLLPVADNSKQQVAIVRKQEQEQEQEQEIKNNSASSADASDAPASCDSDSESGDISPKRPKDVTPIKWKRYLKLRKDKRMPLTVEALERLEREAEKAGKSMAEVIDLCLAKSWGSFSASWGSNEQSTPQHANASPTAFGQISGKQASYFGSKLVEILRDRVPQQYRRNAKSWDEVGQRVADAMVNNEAEWNSYWLPALIRTGLVKTEGVSA